MNDEEHYFYEWLSYQDQHGSHANLIVYLRSNSVISDYQISMTKYNEFLYSDVEKIRKFLHFKHAGLGMIESLDEAYLDWKLFMFNNEQMERKRMLKINRELHYNS